MVWSSGSKPHFASLTHESRKKFPWTPKVSLGTTWESLIPVLEVLRTYGLARINIFVYLHISCRKKNQVSSNLKGEELPDVPFFYQLDRLCSLMRVTVGKFVDFRSAILNAGFRVSISHTNKQALKTDAPIEVIECYSFVLFGHIFWGNILLPSKSIIKALFTRDILAHNIAIKTYF